VPTVVNAGNGADTINYSNAAFDPPGVTILGGDGNDSVVANITQTTSNITPSVTCDGGLGTDSITLNHSTGSTGFFGAPTITNTTLIILGGRNIDYSTFESLVWNSLVNENKSLFIVSTPAGTNVTVNGSSSNENYIIGGLPGFFGTVSMDPILGPVNVNGNGGTDTVQFNDHTTATGKTYTLNATTMNRTGSALVTYATVENLFFNGGTAADTFNIVDHPANVVVTIDGRGGLDTVAVNGDTVGTAVAHFATTQDLALLTVSTGGTAIVDADGNRVINTQGLNLAGTAKLDLNDNDLLLDYTGATQYASIQAKIASGRNGGLWNGAGIISTAAKNRVPKNTTLGILEGSDFKAFYGAAATFDGQALDTSAILVKYTWYGDTDFNGVVNFDDYARADSGFTLHKTGWVNGDFDGNGAVNFDDYSLIDLAFNTQVGTL